MQCEERYGPERSLAHGRLDGFVPLRSRPGPTLALPRNAQTDDDIPARRSSLLDHGVCIPCHEAAEKVRALRRRDRHRDALARRPVEGRSVTVLTLPFSPMDAGSSASVTTGSASSVGDRQRAGRRRRDAVAAGHRSGYRHSPVRGVHAVVLRRDRHRACARRLTRGDRQHLIRATAGATGAAETVTVTSSLEALLSLAVTVLAPPFSEIDAGARHQRDARSAPASPPQIPSTPWRVRRLSFVLR